MNIHKVLHIQYLLNISKHSIPIEHAVLVERSVSNEHTVSSEHSMKKKLVKKAKISKGPAENLPRRGAAARAAAGLARLETTPAPQERHRQLRRRLPLRRPQLPAGRQTPRSGSYR